jgi:hypothetical protein
MKKRYTKQQREDAARQLSGLACQEEWIYSSRHVCRLASLAAKAAWIGRCVVLYDDSWRCAYAEAEAMIRTGWSPS